MFWLIEDNGDLPEVGSIHLSLEDLPGDFLNWTGWRDSLPDKITLEMWDEMFPVQAAANGDQIVVADQSDDPTDLVMYLDHEGGDFDRVLLAPTLEEFMNVWVQLGCPGPESWELEPLFDYDEQKLSLETPTAVAWRKVIHA